MNEFLKEQCRKKSKNLAVSRQEKGFGWSGKTSPCNDRRNANNAFRSVGIGKGFVAALCFGVVVAVPAMAAPTLLWQKSLGGSADEQAVALYEAGGGYFLAGSSRSANGDVSGNHGGNDFWICRTDATGTLQWQKSLGGSADDTLSAAIPTGDGGWLLGGSTRSANGDVTGHHGQSDYWVLKLDASGTAQWKKTFGGSGNDQLKSLVQTTDGGYLLGGVSDSTDGDITGNHSGSGFWVVRLDPSGSTLTNIFYRGLDASEGGDIIRTADGGYLIIGTASSAGWTGYHGGQDILLVKLDLTGNLQWHKCFGGSGDDKGRRVLQTSGGDYLLFGESDSTNGDVTGNHGGPDLWLARITPTGTLLWQKSYGGSGQERGAHLALTPDGGIWLTGASSSNDGDVAGYHGTPHPDKPDLWLVRLDDKGTLQWQGCFGGDESDLGRAAIPHADGSVTVLGESRSTNGDVTANKGAADLWLLKISPSGGTPTRTPTGTPTAVPTAAPSLAPSGAPTTAPSGSPTPIISGTPTTMPTTQPTPVTTDAPGGGGGGGGCSAGTSAWLALLAPLAFLLRRGGRK